MTAAPPPEMIELRRAGSAAIYNLDYVAARAKFEEIRRRWPQHPAGDLYLANTIWLEYLNRIRRLQTSIYQNESFYADFEGTKEGDEKGDAVDPQVDRAFRERMTAAKAKALALVNADRQDPDARYYLGAVYGVLAGYEASTARKFFAAMRNGSRSVEAHQQVIKLKPDYYDAYLSVGLYNYIVGNLPFAVRTLAAMGGVRGNKEHGIRDLESLVKHHSEGADDARVLLVAIHQNEKQPEEALALLKELSARYPRNYLLKMETAMTLSQLNRAPESVAIFEELLKDAAENKQTARALDLIRYQYAESLAAQRNYDRAAEQFIAAAHEASAEPGLATLALLRAGQVYDLSSKRAEAVAQYRAVLTRPKVYDSREQAEKGLKRPYREADKK